MVIRSAGPKERGMVFSGESVRSIIAGQKTQTRRVVKLPSWSTGDWSDFEYDGVEALAICENTGCHATVRCPYGQPGDRLWVREKWQADLDLPVRAGVGGSAIGGDPWWNEAPAMYRGVENVGYIYYAADGEVLHPQTGCGEPAAARRPSSNESITNALSYLKRWLSPIHMPRWASRLTLEIVDVRVERLREISGVDAVAEGVPLDFPGGHHGAYGRAKKEFRSRWDALNAKRGFGWDANPWVWVLTFKRIEG